MSAQKCMVSESQVALWCCPMDQYVHQIACCFQVWVEKCCSLAKVDDHQILSHDSETMHHNYATAHSKERSQPRIFSGVVKAPPVRILIAVSHILLQRFRTKACHTWQKVSTMFSFSRNSSSNWSSPWSCNKFSPLLTCPFLSWIQAR
jgi:hypothetical protein